MNTFEIKRRVEYYEADVTEKLALPMILNWAVLASKLQGDALGVGQDKHLSRGLGWVILQYDVQITRRPSVNEEVTIQTYAAKYNPFFVRRPFAFFDQDGNEIMRVDSVWTMIDIKNRRMVRLPEDIIEAYQAERVKQIPRIPNPVKIEADEDVATQQYRVRYLDIDANQHVNNSRYFEWMQDVMTPEFLATHEITSINLKFENEIQLGHIIDSQVVINDNSSKHRIMTGDVVSAEANFEWREI